MHPLEKETVKIIRQHKLLNKGETVVVGVSGGPDSMALLHVLAALAAALEAEVIAAYVNHGLRPAETAQEEALVKEEAQRLGRAFRTGSVPVREYAVERKISLEHAARLLRYGYLDEVAHECGAAKIAVAHTADDQAEASARVVDSGHLR